MFQKRKPQAEYKEKINHRYVEDVDHTEDDYFKGFVLFGYNALQDKSELVTINGREEVVRTLTLITEANLPFKENDIIRLDGKDSFIIKLVEKIIPKKFEKLVAMNPEVKARYQVKTLHLGG